MRIGRLTLGELSEFSKMTHRPPIKDDGGGSDRITRMLRELVSRDHEDGRATWLPQGVGPRGVPEWYVAGANTRGRTEGRPYPWSQ